MRQDPIELEIFKNIYHSIAEEMGAALRRTAFSPNIKERRDYSCAVFDARGEVIAMGDHMPVHLGSMPMSVRAAIESFPLEPGDMVMLNDPFRGGTRICRTSRSWRRCMCARNSEGKTPSGQPAGTAALQKPESVREGKARIFMWPRAPITRMWAVPIPDRWVCAARSTRKDSAFRQCESCARERWNPMFWRCC